MGQIPLFFAALNSTTGICVLVESNGPVAQLNRVFDYGSKGSRFESWRGHLKVKQL